MNKNLENLRVQKTALHYFGEVLRVTLFSPNEQAMYFVNAPTKERQNQVLRMQDRFSFSGAIKIPFENLSHFVVRRNFKLDGKHLNNIAWCYSLVVADKNRKEDIIDEAFDIASLRRFGEKLAILTKTALKISYDHEKSYNANYYKDIRSWESLNLPHIMRLNFYENTSSSYEMVPSLTSFEKVEVKKRFLEDTTTHFITYKAPNVFDGPDDDRKFATTAVYLSVGVPILGAFSSDFVTFITDFGNLHLIILGYVALLGVIAVIINLLLNYILLETVELSINEKRFICKTSSFLGKKETSMNTKQLEELVVENVERNMLHKNGIFAPVYEKIHFLSDTNYLFVRVDKKKAKFVKDAITTALKESGEKYILDIEDGVADKPSYYDEIKDRLM
jgi:hypothetical protein